jgi:hypothetical protein
MMMPLVSMLGALSPDGSVKISVGSLIALCVDCDVMAHEHQRLQTLDVEEKPS